MYKVGDKVFCIKDCYREFDKLLIFKKNYSYFIYEKKDYNNIIVIKYTNDGYGCDGYGWYSFWFTPRMEDYDFDTYFCDLKEFRKNKLEKIIKEC
jgi:hypothetical protein